MFYEKLNAKHFQEVAAANSYWALDYLLDGQFEKAERHQLVAGMYARFARAKLLSLVGGRS